ncbi:MAG: hypothetical protein KF893_11665 [Caldilineaceae bacterium]|nr:hypothetical protein [Caldilineaceae bacterium]
MLTMRPNLHRRSHTLLGILRISSMAACGTLVGLAFGIVAQNLLIGLILGIGIGAGTGAAIEQHEEDRVDLDQILWAATPLLVFALITLIFWIQRLR